jgi:CRP/FNR family cyclic AMP-dependent transcriptional regulator
VTHKLQTRGVDDATLFSALSVTPLRRLAERGVVRRFPKSTMLIHEGDSGETMFIVLEGRVRVYAANAAGKEVVLGFVGPGGIVGEMSLDRGPRSASVVTIEPTVCSVLTCAHLREQLGSDPEFALLLVLELIHRVREASQSVKSLALTDVYGRLVGLLESLADPVGTQWRVRERLSQQAIAERLGCSRDMISKLFKDLVKGGYLAVSDREITILRKLPAAW